MQNKWQRSDFISPEENFSQEFNRNILVCILLQAILQYIFTEKIFNFWEYNTTGWIIQIIYIVLGFYISHKKASISTEKYCDWLNSNTE